MSSIENPLQINSDVIDNYSAYAEGVDSKNWPLVRSCFADEVIVDYGELSASTGERGVPRPSDDWVKLLQGVINGFDTTRHTITNHRTTFSDGIVTCKAYLIADHVIYPGSAGDAENPIIGPEDVVTFVGEYSNEYIQMDGVWKICKSKLAASWSSGNMALFEQATSKVIAQFSG